jgi:hypothetical protein
MWAAELNPLRPRETGHLGWVAVLRAGDAIANVHHGPYPNASKVEKRKVYVWVGIVNPVVGMTQDAQLGSRRHEVWFDEGQTFYLG